MAKREYDSTVARIAGNIASGMVMRGWPCVTNMHMVIIAEDAVTLARLIVAETIQTEPAEVAE